jgi:hypothetical protein
MNRSPHKQSGLLVSSTSISTLQCFRDTRKSEIPCAEESEINSGPALKSLGTYRSTREPPVGVRYFSQAPFLSTVDAAASEGTTGCRGIVDSVAWETRFYSSASYAAVVESIRGVALSRTNWLIFAVGSVPAWMAWLAFRVVTTVGLLYFMEVPLSVANFRTGDSRCTIA